MQELISQVLDSEFSFDEKKIPLFPNYRPELRMALLILMLSNCCRGNRSSLKRLHILNWALRDENKMNSLLSLLNGELDPDEVYIRFEPSFGRLIDLALGLDIVDAPSGNRIKLTEKGEEMAQSILQTENCLNEEKEFFEQIGYDLSEKLVKNLT